MFILGTASVLAFVTPDKVDLIAPIPQVLSRSVWISAPIIALMFILGTASVLAFVTPDKVDLIAPIPQVLSLGFGSSGWVSTLISLTIFGVAARQIALMSIYFAGNTRLPMVAGWDNLLPQW